MLCEMQAICPKIVTHTTKKWAIPY